MKTKNVDNSILMVINWAEFVFYIDCQKTLQNSGFQPIFFCPKKGRAQFLMVTNWAKLTFLIWHQLGPGSNH